MLGKLASKFMTSSVRKFSPTICAAMRKMGLLLGLFVLLNHTSTGQDLPEGFTLRVIQEDLERGAVGFAFLPDGRMLVIHHQSGRVELIVNGDLKPDPLLIVDSLVTSSEQGLLGIAIDPDYPDSNFVYLFHTQSDSVNQVSRFTMEGELSSPGSDALVIDPLSKKKIFSAPDSTRFHNGGTLRFGQDKTLYVSLGDDAYANDVQRLSNLKGKIIRINRDGSIPVDNPVFPDEPADMKRETFAMGLRNPFRFSIDALTDELFIGDVGTDLYEELNLAVGGENFGYPHYEGPAFFRDFVPLIPPAPTIAAYAYPQSSRGRSVIALATYRSRFESGALDFPPGYEGAYFFADFFDDTLQYLLRDEEGFALHTFGTGFLQLVDAAIAEDGSLYLLSYNGKLMSIGFDGNASTAAERELQTHFTLHQNYPNPFAGKSTVSYTIDKAGNVLIEVFDMLGRQVELLGDRWQPSGTYTLSFDGSRLPAGVYLLHMQFGEQKAVRKMIVTGN